MECWICRIQYTEKSGTKSNIRLNNYRKDVNRQNAPQADQHFKLPYHNFNQYAKFTLIEQLENVNIDESEVDDCIFIFIENRGDSGPPPKKKKEKKKEKKR